MGFCWCQNIHVQKSCGQNKTHLRSVYLGNLPFFIQHWLHTGGSDPTGTTEGTAYVGNTLTDLLVSMTLLPGAQPLVNQLVVFWPRVRSLMGHWPVTVTQACPFRETAHTICTSNYFTA